MLSVVLVDDEPAVLRHLRTIVPWENHGWQIAAVAGDGEDGLAAVEAHEPDLVITDIRMPVLDGMELARRVASLDVPPEIVFLTGYGEFELVRRALQIGVVDYLLKPVDGDKLVEALDRVKKRRLESSRPQEGLETEAWARRALTGNVVDEASPFSQYSVVALHVRCTAEFDPPADLPAGRLVCARRGALDADYLLVVTEYNRAAVQDVARRLIAAAQPATVVVGVGGPANAPARIARSASQARRAADASYYAGTGEPLFAHDFPKPSDAHPNNETNREMTEAIMDVRTRLMSLVRTMDSAGVTSTIADLRTVLQRLRADPFDVGQRLTDLATALRLEFGGVLYAPGPEAAIPTLDDTLGSIRAQVLELIGLLGAKWGARTEPISEWVRRYLRTHYSESVTLKMLGDLAHLNPVYLGQRFREETGRNFQSELLETRMRVAADALRASNAPIHAIARQVGYTAPVNFYRGFKRIHGVSPAQFRATHRQEDS